MIYTHSELHDAGQIRLTLHIKSVTAIDYHHLKKVLIYFRCHGIFFKLQKNLLRLCKFHGNSIILTWPRQGLLCLRNTFKEEKTATQKKGRGSITQHIKESRPLSLSLCLEMQEMDVGRSILFFFVFPLLLLFADDCLSSAAAEKETYYLGFFSPFPNPEENTLIPFHLSEQW